ncbi:PREDICTED: phospholipase D p1-like, partial [Erythranthe guttata]
FKWQLLKKASQVIYLHIALKKRAIIEDFHEKQEQVKEWLQNIGLGDNSTVMHDEDEPDDGAVPIIYNDDTFRKRSVPSRAALSVIRPAIGKQQAISDKAKAAMQGYLDHFLGNLDIINSREVCKFLEVSKLSFSQEYGPYKLKEGYMMVKHLGLFSKITQINIKIRGSSHAKVEDWVTEINAKIGSKRWESWCHPHRFNSFAPIRGLSDDGSQAQWFIDGDAAFEAIASSIENAKSEIYMTGWWLCPELYLRRPFHDHISSRLDFLLEAKAKEGVQIYILLYKEVSLALKINSLYSKKKLMNIHENVKVLRYPDHLSSGIYLWSHHEKLVIVDHKICFIGGLDLCFGRYDTVEHKIGDCPPSLWPGKDYYNPRESEPNSWEDTMKDELDREKYPRMPWHDVHCAVWGPPCTDIARHFVQRWNHAKRSKAPNEQKIPLLMPQHHHMVLPHYLGRGRDVIDIEKNISESDKIGPDDYFSTRTSNPDNDNIPLLLPHETNNGPHSCSITGNSKDSTPNTQSDSDMQKQDQKFENISANDQVTQAGPRCLCHCQVVRSVSQWSAGTSQTEDSIHRAYCALIEEAEYFIYIENQFFISGLSEEEFIQNRVLESLYKRIMRAHTEKRCFRVIIVIPLLPGFQGGVDDGGAATVRAIMHWQYRTISRGESSILQKLCSKLGPLTHDFISFFGLRTYGRLFDGGPVVTSQIYVHSKVMIVDDRCALVGSSNINDRSLLGSRDSEIAVLIQDKEFIDSSMDGNPWKAGRFAFNLRVSLWAEHLGLNAQQVAQIEDPVADTTYKGLWLDVAKLNKKIYEDVFSCIPNDTIQSRWALRQSMSHWRMKLGHTTIDLGVAPENLELYENDELIITDPMEKLKSVRGHLVSFPLDFMSQEDDLRPMFIEGEFYASPQVFH